MQLKSLELVGFKSFPDRTLINFSDGITAIIGPNGSGKSNIADAVRWVMGETSAKNLRGSKTEDVIFDGTQSRKPLGFAEVTLTLLNSDGALNVPYEEVAITRRYYRSGESEYFINKKNVRLRDIQELLRDTGLGKTGYSIIGQGAVTEIITAKSTDRRHFFEEAAGIAGFKFKKEESERKLAQTAENLVRLTDILNELKERMGPLEKQAEKAKKYLTLYEEKKVLEIAVWLDRLVETENEIEKASKACEDLRESLEHTDSDVQKCEDRAEKLSSDIRDITVEVEDIRTKIRGFEETVRGMESEILLLRRDIEHSDADIERIKAEIAGDMEVGTLLRSEISAKNAALTDAEKKAEKLSEVIAAAETEREGCQAKSAEADQKTQTMTEQCRALTSEITVLQMRISGADARKDALRKSAQDSAQELADAKDRLANLEATKKNAADEKEKLAVKQIELKNAISGYNLKFTNRQLRCEKLKNELNDATLKLRQTQDRRHMLEEMEKHYEGFSGSVKSVMNEADKGILRGVCGTVAAVIRTKSEYTVAVEIALGAAIQNIITQTEKDAKNCISMLKSRNLGRATFLPLDTIKGRRLDTKAFASAQGFIGLASDIIECDAKYSEVIASLLGRTVITETLDDATRLARGNNYAFKIVTLDGQVVNAGGSLTGGSVGRNTGILSRANEIETLAVTIEKLSADVDAKNTELRSATAEMNMLSAQIDGINAEIKTAADEQVKRDAELDYCKLYISNINEQIATLQKSVADAEAAIASEGEDTAKTQALISEKDARLEELKTELRAVSDENSDIRQKLDMIRESIYAKEVERVESVKTAENLRAAVAELENRLREGGETLMKREEQIEALVSLNREHEEKIKALTEECSAVKSLADGGNAAIAEKISQRDALESEKNKVFDEEKKLFEHKEKLAREAERMQIRQATLRNDSDSIIAKIWDEYELTLTQAREGGFKTDMPLDDAKKRVAELRASIKALGSVNVGAIEEFAQVKQRHDELEEQTADLTKSRDELLGIISGLVEEMTRIFAEQFKTINAEFSRVYRELFNGGSARLELTDSENLLESGIEIYVAPPGKIIKHLSALSGGEQSLTAIALYFALLHIRPAPFCLLDEIESALDDVNVVRYAQYLSNLSHKTQFLLITHRRGTMEIADRLYGVTMRERGVSKMLTINVKDLANENI